MEKVRHGAWRCKGWVLATFGGRKKAGRLSGLLTSKTPWCRSIVGVLTIPKQPFPYQNIHVESPHPIFNFPENLLNLSFSSS